ncbi:MAG: hypothetical protein R6V49_01635 [Bacteroidales bacterium]
MQYDDEQPFQEELGFNDTGTEKGAPGKQPQKGGTEGEPARKQLWRMAYNKYLLTTLAFIVWLMFFDGNNLISRYRVKKELRSMKHQKEYYLEEIAKNEVIRDQLANDLEKVEQYGREKYLMKRDHEDIFLIIEEEPKQ